jgi:hypothetical protein
MTCLQPLVARLEPYAKKMAEERRTRRQAGEPSKAGIRPRPLRLVKGT